MLAAALAVLASICAVGWFFANLSTKTVLCYMKEKGYTLPTPAELKACSRKAVDEAFTFARRNKR